MVRMRWMWWVVSLCAATQAGAAVPTLGPDQLHPGQKAVVRTVFQGDSIESFDAEIVGVFQGGRVSGDLILARATSDRVLKTGIAQGMSGSPVYVDGKLIGALSSGWLFSREPVFGVTPIQEMLRVLDIPAVPASEGAGSAGPTGIEPSPLAETSFGEFRWPTPGDVPIPAPSATSAAIPLGTDPGLQTAPGPLRVPVACIGLDAAVLPYARRMLEPLGLSAVPGGRGGSGRATTGRDLQPGDAVAVELLRGDLQLAAIGTVTYRDGDRVLIFGHPFFQSGYVKMPLATAGITTIVASDMISFKVGSPGRTVGVATQDRRAAVGGHLGGAPRLMPVSVSISGRDVGRTTYRFESIEDRAMAPQLVALAAANSLMESGGAGSGQTVRWELTLHRKGLSPLIVRDVSVGGLGEMVSSVTSPLQFLYNNPYERLALDSLALRIEVAPGQDLWTVRGVQVLDAAVRPGGTVRARCEVERWRGGRRVVDLALRVPEEVPDGRYVLWVGGASELMRAEAQRLPGRYRPASLPEAWRRLAEMRPPDQLYGTLLARAPEVTRRGRDYPELPTSAMALLSSGGSAEDMSRRGMQALLDEARRPFDGEVRGEVQVEVNVDADAP